MKFYTGFPLRRNSTLLGTRCAAFRCERRTRVLSRNLSREFIYFHIFPLWREKGIKKKKKDEKEKKEGEERSGGEKEKAAILSDVAFSRAEKARKRPETGFVATVDKIEEDVWAVLNREMDKRSLVFVLFGQFNAVYRSPRNFSFFFFYDHS